MSRRVVRTGLDRLLTDERRLVAGRRIGLVVNHTSVDATLTPSFLTLPKATDLRVAALFGPEHGLWGTHQDMEPVDSGPDAALGRRVESLYGDEEGSLLPVEARLRELDAVVFDIQDVGARYYTFAYTLLHVMEVAARAGCLVIVCDRPNPLGGRSLEGNLVTPDYRSFVGRWPLPNRHALTVGELALLFHSAAPCPLEIVRMEGWERGMWFDDTHLPWVAPSPNMPTLATATVYPGMCLLEGTNLSEGRGTTRPFELFGAPWLDPAAFAARLNAAELAGIRFRPAVFRPMFQKHAGRLCGGAEVHVVDRDLLEPVLLGLTVLQVARELAPADFRWREERYEYVSDRLAIDLLAGTDRWRRALEAGVPPAAILDESAGDLRGFAASRREVLLYDEGPG